MEFVRGVIHRVVSRPLADTVPYTLGRFAQVRSVYGYTLGLLQRAGAVTGLSPVSESLFLDLRPEPLIDAIRRESAAFGLRLPDSITATLATAARAGTLQQWQTGRRFTAADVDAGRLPDGTGAVLADLVDASLLSDVQRVARDPLLLDVIAGYLGYRPVGCDPRILYSFAGDYSEDERRNVGQTFEYHFDVHSYNFAYVNIYLVDVDEGVGAHVMVLGSHANKPMRWLFGSAKRSDASIEIHYPPEQIRTIVGPAGTGFIQDSSCYHKVLAPRTRDRIMLHMRYF